MRWRWIDREATDELRRRDEVIGRIDAWWKEFAERTSDIDELFRRQASWDLPAWMTATLQAIDPQLMWEYGPARRGEGHRLVITPEASHWLRPVVATTLERAPQIPGWEFYGHRLREPLAVATAAVEARTGFTVTTASVEVSVADHRVHLRYRFPECREEGEELATNAAFVATESLLGEDVLDAWVGAIDSAPVRRPILSLAALRGPAGVEFGDLAAAVDAEIVELRRGLPPFPCVDLPDDWKWSLWELGRRELADCAAQDDLLVGRSALPAMWRAARHAAPFVSSCFSNHGETFCYLKVDGSAPEAIGGLADKGEVEDALDEALRGRRLGAVVGGGSGWRYSHVDLALLDVERGVAAIRDALQRAGVTRRAWVLFFDAALAQEWLGVWPDSPPPLTGEDAVS